MVASAQILTGPSNSETKVGPRKLSSWVQGFNRYTEKIGSPPLFTKWAGIFTVAAALERKVWVTTNKGRLYPNLYVFFVGPPGAGKTVAEDKAAELFVQLEDHHLAPTSMTKASLIDRLSNSERKLVMPKETPPVISFNSLTIMANELGTMIPSYEGDFMNVLTDLYDCKRYSETRRTNKIDIQIANPQLNFIAATTPSYLNGLLPEGAWDQGFLSRTILIYSGGIESHDLWAENTQDKALTEALVFDLKSIGGMYGELKIDDEVKAAFTEWQRGGRQPVPEHPKLAHYNTRRAAHLLKLCAVACCSTGDRPVITLEHYAEALDWLLEAEHSMSDIFRSMTMGASTRVMDDVWYHTYMIFMKEKKPVMEHRLIAYLSERVPAHDVGRILEVMTRAKIFEGAHVAGMGMCYTPRAPKPR